MNLLFCGDKNAEKGIFTAVLSIVKNCDAPINLYIFTAKIDNFAPISFGFGQKTEKLIKEYNSKSNLHLIDVSDKFNDYLPKANINTRFTPMCMLRLFADKVESIPDKILYLDADIICRRNILPLYETDISAFEVAGIPDRYGKWLFGNVFKHDYLNSGVLLMNMKRIRESGMLEKCRSLCQNKKMLMPDQSAINKTAIKKKLNKRYNEQGRIKRNTVIKHFSTFFIIVPPFKITVKPWERERVNKVLKIYEFDELFNEAERRYCNE